MSTRRLLAVQDQSGPRVQIVSRRPPLRVSAMLDVATRSGGYGGWDVIDRVRQVGFTEWQGVGPAEMSVQIVLWHPDRRDQEPAIRNLERMASPERAAGNQPPHVRLHGALPAHHTMRWLIQGIEWSDEIIERRRRDGHRIRQGATLQLLQRVEPTLAFARSAAQRRALARPKVRVVVAREGDTLTKIAVREAGSVARWTDIRDLNPGLDRDGRTPIRPGTKVRVPGA